MTKFLLILLIAFTFSSCTNKEAKLPFQSSNFEFKDIPAPIHPNNQKAIDSLKKIIKSNPHDTVVMNSLYYLGRSYWDILPDSNLTKTFTKVSNDYANQLLKLSESINNYSGMGDAYYILGCNYRDNEKNTLKGLELHNKSLVIRRKAGIPHKIGKILNYMSTSYADLNLDSTMDWFYESIRIFEKYDPDELLGGTYHNIAMKFNESGNISEAKKYFLKSIDYELNTKNKDWLGRHYMQLSELYLLENNIKEAEINLEKAKYIFLKIGGDGMYGYSLISYSNILNQKNEYLKAIDTLYKAINIFHKVKDKNGIALTHNYLGLAYTHLHKFKEAEISLDTCLRLCRELGPGAMQNVYERLYFLDSARGNYASAFVNYRNFIHLRDSLNNKENIQKIERQRVKYEYSKLEEKNKAEQEKAMANYQNTRNMLILGLVLVIIIVLILYNRYRLKQKSNELITIEKERSEALLLNILPEKVAEELKNNGNVAAEHFDEVTIMFTDFKDFTKISENLSPTELVDEIHYCFKEFDNIITKYNIEKIKTIGDSYMCASGLTNDNNENASNIVRAALEIRDFMQDHSKKRLAENKEAFEIRIGINTGPVVAGIVGIKKFAYDIWGDTVNIASRMESSGEVGKVNISAKTYEIVKDQFECTYRGKVDAKNKGEIDMYFVEDKR